MKKKTAFCHSPDQLCHTINEHGSLYTCFVFCFGWVAQDIKKTIISLRSKINFQVISFKFYYQNKLYL